MLKYYSHDFHSVVFAFWNALTPFGDATTPTQWFERVHDRKYILYACRAIACAASDATMSAHPAFHGACARLMHAAASLEPYSRECDVMSCGVDRFVQVDGASDGDTDATTTADDDDDGAACAREVYLLHVNYVEAVASRIAASNGDAASDIPWAEFEPSRMHAVASHYTSHFAACRASALRAGMRRAWFFQRWFAAAAAVASSSSSVSAEEREMDAMSSAERTKWADARVELDYLLRVFQARAMVLIQARGMQPHKRRDGSSKLASPMHRTAVAW
jgi:hypothetical protein